MSAAESELLLRYARDRDPEAFRELVERHQHMVFATCKRILGNAADAEDSAQDCFLQLARKAGRLSGSPAAWLHRVASGVAIDRLRSKRARRAREAKAVGERQARNELSWAEVRTQLDAAIEALPDDLRTPIVLHYLESRRQNDIAAELGLTQSAVSKRLQRGVDMLRRRLGKAGVTATVAGLIALVSANAVEAAPPTLTAALGKMALAGPSAAVAGSVAGGATAMKITAVTLIAAAAITATVVAVGRGGPPAAPVPAPAPITAAPETPAEVPDQTRLDILHAAGHALRTLARLEAKLEKAHQEGDEVRVPGWTVDDDRALARALADLTAAGHYANMAGLSRTAALPIENVEALLRSPDADLRVGALLALAIGKHPHGERDKAEQKRLLATLLPMTRDANPCVRAVSVAMALQSLRKVRDHEAWAAVLEMAAKDPAPEVRLAAIIGIAGGDQPVPAPASLLRDESAVVRVASAFVLLAPNRRREDETASRGIIAAFLQERNPIARLCGVFMVGANLRTDSQRKDLMEMVAALPDPWLKTCARLVSPLFAPRQERPKAVQEMPRTVAELLASPKPSHQVLGAFGALASLEAARPRTDSASGAEEQNPLAQLAPMAESERMWRRLPAILLSRYIGDGRGEARLLAALRSEEEVERLAALGAYTLPSQPSRSPSSAQLNAAILTSFGRPRFVEIFAASGAMARSLPFEEVLALLRKEIASDPGSVRACLLAESLAGGRATTRAAAEERRQAQARLLEAVLAAGNADLEQALLRRSFAMFRPRAMKGGGLCVRFIRACRPESLYTLLKSSQVAYYFQQVDETVHVEILSRLEALFESAHAADRSWAVKSCAALLPRLPRVPRVPGKAGPVGPVTDKTVSLLARMTSACFADKGPAVKDGFVLLAALLDPNNVTQVQAKALPAAWRQAVATALDYANDKTHGRRAAELLGNLYAAERWGTWKEQIRDPALQRAMNQAGKKITASGIAADQVVVLCGRVWGRAGPACAELERRMMAGAVPPDLREQVLKAMSRAPDLLSAEFVAYGIGLFEAGEGNWPHRRRLGRLLASAADVQRRSRNKPLPAWLPDAAQAGLRIADDEARPPIERALGLKIHVKAAGEAAGKKLETLIRNAETTLLLRVTAAKMLPNAAPATMVYRDLLADQAAFPASLRAALAGSAAQSPQAAGAEAFFLVVLKADLDRRLRWDLFRNIKLPDTPALRAALTELKDDPQMSGPATSALRQLDRKAGRGRPARPRPAPRPRSRAQVYATERATLKNLPGRKVDSVQKHLTWYALPDGVALDDAGKKEVHRFARLFEYTDLKIHAMAFGPDKVWIGTDKGLIAWDRKARFWTRFAVGGTLLEVSVTALSFDEKGRLRVTVRSAEQQPQKHLYDPRQGRWQEGT